MNRAATLKLALSLLAGALVAGPAAARDQIRIVGSSTVFPFATAVAEHFGQTTKYPTPVIESTGTGGGFKLFCGGVGLDTPDISDASRPIKETEAAACKAAGVKEIVEVKFGFDGIVLASAKASPTFTLTKGQIFLALAKQVPVNGKLVPNPYKKWSDVDPSLPDEKIEVLGPPPTSGTRDAFVELAMEKGAKEFPTLVALAAKDEEEFKAAAQSLREDGAWIDAGENDNLIVQKLVANPKALGVFGYSFLEENSDRLKGATVDGVAPEFDAISSGKYAISRSLFFYVKAAHVGQVPGIAEYVREFLSARAAGEDGYLADKGLIPLPAAELDRVRAEVEKKIPGMAK